MQKKEAQTSSGCTPTGDLNARFFCARVLSCSLGLIAAAEADCQGTNRVLETVRMRPWRFPRSDVETWRTRRGARDGFALVQRLRQAKVMFGGVLEGLLGGS